MLIELSIGWVITLNVLAWLVIQLGLAWAFTQISSERFNPQHRFARIRKWECNGRLYERVFAIKLWKDRLPDGSRLFRGGFSKALLKSATAVHVDRFLRETWRGEIVHWLALLALPVFCIWNPWWGVLVNAVVAVSVNLPCILALRYNRARFKRLLEKLSRDE